jgi:hypothetical protein
MGEFRAVGMVEIPIFSGVSAGAESYQICARPYLQLFLGKGVARDFLGLQVRSLKIDCANRVLGCLGCPKYCFSNGL